MWIFLLYSVACVACAVAAAFFAAACAVVAALCIVAERDVVACGVVELWMLMLLQHMLSLMLHVVKHCLGCMCCCCRFEASPLKTFLLVVPLITM